MNEYTYRPTAHYLHITCYIYLLSLWRMNLSLLELYAFGFVHNTMLLVLRFFAFSCLLFLWFL